MVTTSNTNIWMNLDMIDSTIVEIKTKLLLDCLLEIGRYLLANKGKASNSRITKRANDPFCRIRVDIRSYPGHNGYFSLFQLRSLQLYYGHQLKLGNSWQWRLLNLQRNKNSIDKLWQKGKQRIRSTIFITWKEAK